MPQGDLGAVQPEVGEHQQGDEGEYEKRLGALRLDVCAVQVGGLEQETTGEGENDGAERQERDQVEGEDQAVVPLRPPQQREDGLRSARIAPDAVAEHEGVRVPVQSRCRITVTARRRRASEPGLVTLLAVIIQDFCQKEWISIKGNVIKILNHEFLEKEAKV